MFDLIIFPLSLDTGLEKYELPGLLVTGASRKAARMRAQDQLVIYCRLVTIPGSSRAGVSSGRGITAAQQREIINRLAETYFKFSGSITAGLRAVTARLNEFLLNRNLKATQEGQTVGTLNLAVIHGSRLVVAHAGVTHSFVLNKNQVLHYDDSQAARGLGLSRQAVPRFYQTTLEAGDLLVVCADPPAAWTARTLANSPQLSFEHLRRRLLGEAGEDLQVGVVRFQTGKGQISYWHPGEAKRPAERTAGEGRPIARPSVSRSRTKQEETRVQADLPQEPPVLTEYEAVRPPESEEQAVSPEQTGGPKESIPLVETDSSGVAQEPPAVRDAPNMERSEEDRGDTGAEKLAEQAGLTQISARQEQAALDDKPEAHRSAPGKVNEIHPSRKSPFRTRPAMGRDSEENAANARLQKQSRTAGKQAGPRKPGAIRQGLSAFLQKIRMSLLWTRPLLAASRRGVSAAASRVIPRKVDAQGRPEPFFNLSPAQMLAIALITPLIVVAVSATIFFRLGRGEQFQQKLLTTQHYVQQAEQQKDPVQQRESWKQAYAMLLEADAYGNSDESRALKHQILSALDELEGFVRLNYQPVMSGGFPADVKITRIVATLNDVYLLDSSQGRILRLYRTGSGYEVDPAFSCGAGKAGTMIINPLIDLAALPPNNEMHSTVMGIDAGGNLVYCSPSQSGFDSRPLALPDSGWGTIVGITLNNDTLYILDPKANAVYRYDGNNGIFPDRPHLYFDATIPQMNDVIDLAVDQEFLYLLHSDGRMTVCESSGFEFTATKCTDPAPYGDTRPGYEPAPLTFLGAHFIHIQTTQPPDPSLFALDAANRSIYHLSLRRLNLQRQYLPVDDPDYPLPNDSPTAFAISPNRRALLAFGNQVFFATIP